MRAKNLFLGIAGAALALGGLASPPPPLIDAPQAFATHVGQPTNVNTGYHILDDTNTVDLDTTYVYDGENLNIVVHNDAPDPGEGGSPLTGIGETAIPLACIGFIVAGVIAVVILRFKKNYLLGVGGHE